MLKIDCAYVRNHTFLQNFSLMLIRHLSVRSLSHVWSPAHGNVCKTLNLKTIELVWDQD